MYLRASILTSQRGQKVQPTRRPHLLRVRGKEIKVVEHDHQHRVRVAARPDQRQQLRQRVVERPGRHGVVALRRAHAPVRNAHERSKATVGAVIVAVAVVVSAVCVGGGLRSRAFFAEKKREKDASRRVTYESSPASKSRCSCAAISWSAVRPVSQTRPDR